MNLLRGAVRNYAWGSRTDIAEFTGMPSPAAHPEAELWLGANPGDPASLQTGDGEISLLDVIQADPDGQLGPQVRARFGDALPFLAKVLAADEPLSLGLTKALVRRCALLVTTDSGPRHFAAAFDRPVLTLFGPTHIAWTETYFAKAKHLQKAVPCGPCQKRVCHTDHACMRLITPEEVFAEAGALLAKHGTTPFPQGHAHRKAS